LPIVAYTLRNLFSVGVISAIYANVLKAKSISSLFAFLQRASHCSWKTEAEKARLKCIWALNAVT